MNKIAYIITIISIVLFSCEKNEEPQTITAIDKQILELVNEHRESIGKPALAMNDVIWEEAHTHSRNMADGKVDFGHDGFEDRIYRIHEKIGGGAAAENVAYGYTTAEQVVSAWLDSEGHKKNIEGDYTLTGVSAVKSSDGTYYFTQIFLYK